jgi:hypothetical protein
MRILTWGAVAAVLLAGAPVALAHEGSPNFLSQINEVTPAGSGLDVQVLNRDDRLLLINGSDKTVLIEGYEGEPYARLDPDGTVEVNKDSRAYYINEERDGKVGVPDGVDSKGEPQWEEVSRTGRFEWHDHRMHWMSEDDPEAVKDKDVRTKVYDWKVPISVDGQDGLIAGTLFWTPVPSSGPSLPLLLGLGALVLVSAVAAVIRLRRRTAAPASEAW